MIKFNGLIDSTARFLQKEYLSDKDVWKKFVEVYEKQFDDTYMGWRGEYWGKMMRGAVLVYKYTRDEEFFKILTDTVKHIMSVAEEDGRISAYTRDNEFKSWDMWCRKYVILGCEYYLEVCKDEQLKKEIITFISRSADYIMAHVGEGKLSITRTSNFWLGINSSSILEPIVKLYKWTGDKKYLDFATYIVNTGAAEGINIFELAYENKLLPYQYGVPKAYEMMSCFEGLLEYYYVTGVEKYKKAVVNFANAILASEISIIGCSGITHELFDHTSARQTVKYDGVMQETCVTVTWMKFCSRILELTGDSKYADAMEKSFYNAYLGAVNEKKRESHKAHELYMNWHNLKLKPSILPFDSYSPLTPGKRGQGVGGAMNLCDDTYYGCCACIGAAGVGVFAQNAITASKEGITVNFYETGKANFGYCDAQIAVAVETEYPVNGKIKIRVTADKPTQFTLKLRSPEWAKGTTGYIAYDKVWSDETIELNFDMPLVFHYPQHWEKDVIYTDTSKEINGYCTGGALEVIHLPEEDNYFAVTVGPLVLGADERTGKNPETIFLPTYNAKAQNCEIVEGEKCLIKLKFTPENGEEYYLVDYASAGKDWTSTIAAWLPTKR
ncbi:MAG: glycoside hydrolase family 127 protein [Clostridia bacterium]|nr:glycoside hydrolase family 127 protein [Clostridia bacterium]